MLVVLNAERRQEIEERARALRYEIFNNRQLYWPDRNPNGLEVADPELAAHVLGLTFQSHDTLDLVLPGVNGRTAGIYCRKKGLILVARRFGPVVARFTAAHEVGHALFHENEINPVLHRDLPIQGLEHSDADPIEREANYFAGCFLMPRKYVVDQFRKRFPSDGPLVLDEAALHHLRSYSADALLYALPGSLLRERILVKARSWDNNHFPPLHDVFKVSAETMAIRIKELGLIR